MSMEKEPVDWYEGQLIDSRFKLLIPGAVLRPSLSEDERFVIGVSPRRFAVSVSGDACLWAGHDEQRRTAVIISRLRKCKHGTIAATLRYGPSCNPPPLSPFSWPMWRCSVSKIASRVGHHLKLHPRGHAPCSLLVAQDCKHSPPFPSPPPPPFTLPPSNPLPPNTISPSKPRLAARRTAKLASSLSSPHLSPTCGIGASAGRAYAVYEGLPGGVSLARKLNSAGNAEVKSAQPPLARTQISAGTRTHPPPLSPAFPPDTHPQVFSPTEAIGICHAVAETLDTMHSSGLVHGSLSTSTIFIDDNGAPKVPPPPPDQPPYTIAPPPPSTLCPPPFNISHLTWQNQLFFVQAPNMNQALMPHLAGLQRRHVWLRPLPRGPSPAHVPRRCSGSGRPYRALRPMGPGSVGPSACPPLSAAAGRTGGDAGRHRRRPPIDPALPNRVPQPQTRTPSSPTPKSDV